MEDSESCDGLGAEISSFTFFLVRNRFIVGPANPAKCALLPNSKPTEILVEIATRYLGT